MHKTFKKHIEIIIGKLNYPKIDVQVQVPKQIDHGDLTTNTAMILAKQIKENPIKMVLIKSSVLKEIKKSTLLF